MSVNVIMHKVTMTGNMGAGPRPVIASRTDITHSLTSVGEIEESLSINGDFVAPEFEFKVDNVTSPYYMPNYAIRTFMDYYNMFIKGDRVHVEVRWTDGTTTKTIFYGALNSVIPSVDLEKQELTFVATQIVKSALADTTMLYMMDRANHESPRRGSIYEKYYEINSLMPTFFGPEQTFDFSTIPNLVDTYSTGTKQNYQVLWIHENYLADYDKQLDFFGDFLRAMCAYYVWEDNKFRFYGLDTIWTANAAVSLDTVLCGVGSVGPWTDAADDVTIDCGDAKMSYADMINKTGVTKDGRRPFAVGSQTIRTKNAVRSKSYAGASAGKTIDTAMLAYLRIKNMHINKPSKYRDNGDNPNLFAMYGDYVLEPLVLKNYEFWCKHKVAMDVEAIGLAYFYGRKYTIRGQEWKCIQVNKDLAKETTKLKLIGNN